MDAVFVFDRKHETKSTRKKPATRERGLVQVRIYHRGNVYYRTTGVYLLPTEWDQREGMPKQTTPELKAHYKLLQRMLRTIEDNYNFMQDNGQQLFSYNVDALFASAQRYHEGNFVDFIRKEIENDNTLAPRTKVVHRQLVKKLAAFKSFIPFHEVNYNLIHDFNNHLFTPDADGVVLHPNTIEGQHRRLRRYINLAIRRGKLLTNPYKDFKLKTIPSEKIPLTFDDIAAIESLNYEGMERQQRIKDLFLFAVYTGLRYQELIKLTEKEIQRTPNGYELHLQMIRKTPTPLFLPVWQLFDGKGGAIMDKYWSGERFRLPHYENQKLNYYLKDLAHDAGITKLLTCHIARHTFGTIVGAVTGDAYLIKDLMGHADIKTSMVYVKSSPEIIRRKLAQYTWK